jgi:hypothetical protein
MYATSTKNPQNVTFDHGHGGIVNDLSSPATNSQHRVQVGADRLLVVPHLKVLPDMCESWCSMLIHVKCILKLWCLIYDIP